MAVDYTTVTEIAGDDVSREQVERLCNRYYWAGEYCGGKDVLEVACGTGQGLGYLAGIARSIQAGDFSLAMLRAAQAHYRGRISLSHLDAQRLPFRSGSLDVVLLFEALYYVPAPDDFVAECRRVLRPGGQVLIATANKDLYDFNPSPYSHHYHGVPELGALFGGGGFRTEFMGAFPMARVSSRQRLLRWAKRTAVTLGLMPTTMAGKRLLKRLVFGRLVPMPREIDRDTAPYAAPEKVSSTTPDRTHKVVYCVATRSP